MSCSGCASVLWEETLHWNKPLTPSQGVHPYDHHCTTENTLRMGKICCISELLITAGQTLQCSWEGKEGRKNRNRSGLLLLSSSDFLVRKSFSCWRWEVVLRTRDGRGGGWAGTFVEDVGVMLVHRAPSSPEGKGVPWEVQRGMRLAGQEVMKAQINQISKLRGGKALEFLFLAYDLSS